MVVENVVVNTDNNTQKFDYLEFYSNFNLEKIPQYLRIFVVEYL